MHRPDSCHYSINFLFRLPHLKLHLHQNQINTKNNAVQQGRKEEKTVNNKLEQSDSMDSPFEMLGRHFDPAHFDAISHETSVLPNWTQNSDSLPRIVSGDWQEDWKSQVSVAISRGSGKFFFSACWGKNEFC